MSKKPRAFRPAVADMLETRTVPSGFHGYGMGDNFFGNSGRGGNQGGFGGGGIGMGGNSGVQTLATEDTQAIQKAFNAFEQSYQKDLQTILYGSSTPTATTRSAFDTQVTVDLQTLNTAIDAAITNITGSSNPSLASTIESDLIGSGTGSLQSELAALSTPASSSVWSGRIFDWEANAAMVQASRTINQLVSTAAVPATTITSSTVSTLKTSITTAYQTFTQGYVNATQTTATDPATNRAAFDTAVQALVSSLNTSISTAVTAADLPSSVATSLTTTLTADLSGTPTKGTSLQAGLAALGSPSSSTGFAGWYFQGRSRNLINGSERTVVTDILSAVNTYNASLSS